jgi:energy-converting hydrogenase B subunit D
MLEIIQFMVLTGMIASAAACLKSRDLMVSLILLCAMSLLLAAEFYILQAPDAAIAEASIGAGIATAVYVKAVEKTRRWENEKMD